MHYFLRLWFSTEGSSWIYLFPANDMNRQIKHHMTCTTNSTVNTKPLQSAHVGSIKGIYWDIISVTASISSTAQCSALLLCDSPLEINTFSMKAVKTHHSRLKSAGKCTRNPTLFGMVLVFVFILMSLLCLLCLNE